MLLAARKLQGIGLVLLVLIIAMTLYPVSLRVAATRSELAQVESDVMKARLNIRYLETEFSARASLRQLERWNADTFGYPAPEAAQFLSGERALAELDSLRPIDAVRTDRTLLAVAVVPAVAPGNKSAAQMILDASIPSAKASETAQPLKSKMKATADAAPPSTVATAKPKALAKTVAAPSPAAADRAQRIAMLDKQLLTPAALKAIDLAAQAEAGTGRTQ